VAKTTETARQLGKAWEARTVQKSYLAIVHGHMQAPAGCIAAPLGKDAQAQTAIKDCVREDGWPAVTRYRLSKSFRRREGDFSLVEVAPETGRKHQIRIHLAHIGHPIVGDKLYGGDEQIYLDFVRGQLTAEQRKRLILDQHALHAVGLVLPPWDRPRAFVAEPEPAFQEFCELPAHVIPELKSLLSTR
jgi:23S rRNA pseudouridine1911/1915/1917 synthase